MALAAVVGGAGLAFYLATHAAGIDLTVVPEDLPAVWWRIPVLILSAAENALLEEALVAGYLLHRLRQLDWTDNRALALSATLRGSCVRANGSREWSVSRRSFWAGAQRWTRSPAPAISVTWRASAA